MFQTIYFLNIFIDLFIYFVCVCTHVCVYLSVGWHVHMSAGALGTEAPLELQLQVTVSDVGAELSNACS